MHPVRCRFVAAWLLPASFAAAQAFAASPAPVQAEHGMVVSAQRLASDVGVEVLRGGGNAVDAAVAVGYALAVTYPTAGNLGGGGFMTVRMADGRTSFLDFRERAPLAASRTMYLDEKGEVRKGASTDGFLAVGVPGTVMGLETARVHFGTKAREALMAPAIRLARQGFALSQGDAVILKGGAKKLGRDPAASAIFLGAGGAPKPAGTVLFQPDLAASLDAISAGGPDAFYKGKIADAVVAASRAGGGVLAREDFERYAVRELAPVSCTYRGYQILSAPPPSSGGVILCEILNVLEGYPLAYLGWNSAETVHLMTEAMRFAFTDRNAALGDPAFVENPAAKLTDKGYAAAIRKKIERFEAGRSAGMAPFGAESPQTTHYSVIDEEGNAVAVTTTLNAGFGTGIVAPGTGILLNNEMDDFTAKPGQPNLYGLVQGEANAVQPGKTPLSSMSPTIVLKDGKPFLVIGSPGGPRIITITLQAILNVIDFGMNIGEAVDAPRIHHQALPDKLFAEAYALSPDTQRLLAGMGYDLDVADSTGAWGQAAGILVGGKSLAEIQAGGGVRFNGAIDARASAGAASGY